MMVRRRLAGNPIGRRCGKRQEARRFFSFSSLLQTLAQFVFERHGLCGLGVLQEGEDRNLISLKSIRRRAGSS